MKYKLIKKEVIYEYGSLTAFAKEVGCVRQNVGYHTKNNISSNNKILDFCIKNKKMYLLKEIGEE